MTTNGDPPGTSRQSEPVEPTSEDIAAMLAALDAMHDDLAWIRDHVEELVPAGR